MGPYNSKDMAQYVVDRRKENNDTVTPLQLMKIVYLCHGWLLGIKGRPLVNDAFEAWQYGPVSRELYEAVRHYRSSPVTVVKGAKALSLDSDEFEVVNNVIDFYAKFDGLRLSALTHEPRSPWDITWSSAGKNAPISNDLIEHFYARQAAAQQSEDAAA